MTKPTVTALPDPPTRRMKAEFNTQTIVFLEALRGFSTEMIAVVDWIDDSEAPSGGAYVSKTITSGVVDASDGIKRIDLSGEGGAADTLTEVQATAVGDLITFINSNAESYPITIANGPYLKLASGIDFTLDSIYDSITLRVHSMGANDICAEYNRSNNG